MAISYQLCMRKNKYKRRLYSFWLLCILGVVVLAFDIAYGENNWIDKDVSSLTDTAHYHNRELLAVELENCTPPAIEQFPYPFFSKDVRLKGGIALHIFIGAYMFLALAIACDEYFVPACEKVSDAMNLESDVAGATFMAAGSSAPELATSVIAVFIAKDDIGLGAVVGSAVFNIMFVISICALFAGMVVYLNWWPMFRDSLCYTISILALTLVIVDDLVQWYEGLVLLLLYLLYIVLMIFNSQMEAFFVTRFRCCGFNKVDGELTPVVTESPSPSNHQTFDLPTESDSEKEPEDTSERHSLLQINSSEGSVHEPQENGTNPDHMPIIKVKTHLEESEEESPFSVPTGCCKVFLWVISLPLLAVMFITVPDCRKKRWERCWWMTFIMSIVWISVFSYFMVWMITVVGHTAHIPDSIMALTFLAAGTSVPDLISSILVCKQGSTYGIPDTIMSLTFLAAGTSVPDCISSLLVTQDGSTFDIPDTIMGYTFIAAGASVPDAIASLLVTQDGLGDMAISNAIGSNVFDILLCLGLPYFLKSTIVNGGDPVEVYSRGLTYSSLTLLTTVVFLLVSIHLNGWKLDKKYGVILMIVYLLFNILCILYELNIFGYVHPPECPTSI